VLKLGFSEAARPEGEECKVSGLVASPLACNVQKIEKKNLCPNQMCLLIPWRALV
jgi:hypothetical protein